MLKPRLAVVRPLSIYLALGSIAALGVFGGFLGCQGPDTFLRNGGASGGSNGSGGSSFGAGGRVGSGGTNGAGGTSFGSGGSGMGGRVGTGGSGTGGRAGAGGSAIGGTTGGGGMTGTGGARDAGGDMTAAGGSGGAIVDASSDSEGGVIGGTGPCAGLCSNPVVLTMTTNPAISLGNGATCHEVPGTVGHIVCGNFSTKVLSVNGTAVVCGDVTGSTITVPPTTLNGGYCIQSTVGEHSFAYFATY